jgi:glyoxylase-like metal-dependent hydrolase (beta-lactamase superfamily II)
VLGTTGLAFAATPPAFAVAPGVYALMGQPGEISPANLGRIVNVAFVVGPRGVVVVESGVSFRHGEEIIAAVGRITRKPIRLVVITHASQEVVFGAAAFQARGIPVWMHRESAALMAQRCGTCLRNLRSELGERAMAGSRVVEPDRVVGKSQPLDVIGRRLMLIAPDGQDTTGTLALLDETTGTLIAGSLVSIDRIPDLRDVGGKGWPGALAALKATKCIHLIPAFGRIGSCADIDALARYFAALDGHVRALLAAGVGLAELPERCDLPEFAAWDGYAALHPQNANRAYLRIERDSFKD